jgi:hypothetical protein
LTPDPIGQTGGNNLFNYVENNPVNSADPKGLIKWSGSSLQISAVELVGASFTRFQLESQCVNDRKAVITIWAVGPSIGVGAKVSATASAVSFEDFSSTIDPNRFNGIFMIAQAGITFHAGVPIRPPGKTILPGRGPGVGLGLASIRLGDAFSDPVISIGATIGYDKSITGTVGSSTVMDVKYYDCHCENEK